MIIFWGKQQNTLWWGPFWVGQIHAECWQLTLSEFLRYLRVSEAVARVTASFQFWHSELVRSQVYQNSVLIVLRSHILFCTSAMGPNIRKLDFIMIWISCKTAYNPCKLTDLYFNYFTAWIYSNSSLASCRILVTSIY